VALKNGLNGSKLAAFALYTEHSHTTVPKLSIFNADHIAFKPGAKEHFTHFKIQSSSCGTWHLVHGTEIASMIPGVPISPDISLQDPSSNNHPSAGQIRAIWDAKFHRSNGHSKKTQKRVTRPEYQSVVWNRDKLNVPKPPNDCPLKHFPPAFEASGIITNVQGPQSSTEMSKTDKISIVVNFQNATSPTSFTRKEHEYLSSVYTGTIIQRRQRRTIKLSKKSLNQWHMSENFQFFATCAGSCFFQR